MSHTSGHFRPYMKFCPAACYSLRSPYFVVLTVVSCESMSISMYVPWIYFSDDVTTLHLLCNYDIHSISNLKKVSHNIQFSPSINLNKSDLFLVQHLDNILSRLSVHVSWKDGFQRCINSEDAVEGARRTIDIVLEGKN